MTLTITVKSSVTVTLFNSDLPDSSCIHTVTRYISDINTHIK